VTAASSASAWQPGIVPFVLRAAGLRKTYLTPSGPVHAVTGFGHEFTPGAITAVLGPSGSGKSTLLNLLAGFDTPSDGEVWLGDVAMHDLDERRRSGLRLRRLGFMFQSFNLVAVLSAEQNVALPMGLAGVPAARRQERARALLDRFGLLKRRDHLPHRLSGGERQRVALARALANDPDVVFADEPTGALDSATGALVFEALASVAADGRTVVLVTHDATLAARADERVRLRDGRLVAVERPVRLLQAVAS
jgi:putative ABC transport system ATP-binding protein